MGLFSRKTETSSSTETGINPRTGRPFKTDTEFWNDLAKDADQRAARADSKEGRKAMEKNARDFRRRAR
jgi:plasmid maintenance system antidote protein VapI